MDIYNFINYTLHFVILFKFYKNTNKININEILSYKKKIKINILKTTSFFLKYNTLKITLEIHLKIYLKAKELCNVSK